MPLTSGSRVGPYDIVAPIGAGGMGEVYRAHDTKLNRDVALKVLPEAFTFDPERLARFRREAQVLASLNHPNIAHIYGFEDSGSTHALVLELVEGPTLADRIAKGPIPLEEALPIAKQIAEALEAAHEQGIIHRDLKPANIKVRDDGTVKVLDFGLAKALEPASAISPSLTNSPTITSPAMMTGVGTLLGTAAYMSPEQAKGRPADKRSDVWAFGCVLYEMLTGKRAFEGDGINDVLASVLLKQPNWSVLPSSAPDVLLHLLRRCFEKDTTRRQRDIGDARLDISDALTATTGATIHGERPPVRGGQLRGLLFVGVLALAVMTAVVVVRSRRPTSIQRPLIRLDVELGQSISLPAPAPNANRVAISPDGSLLVYEASDGGSPSRLFIRRLSQPKAQELTGTIGANSPFVSPDSKWVGFYARNAVSKVSVDGGSAIQLTQARNFVGATWGEDGSLVLGEAFVHGLTRIPPGGGSPQSITELSKGELVHGFPQVLPGNKAVLFTVYGTQLDIAHASIEVVTLSDHHRQSLVKGATSGRYVSSGHLIYVSKGTLFAIAFNPGTLQTQGAATPILDDLAYSALTNVAPFDASDNGTFVYRPRGGMANPALRTIQSISSSGRRMPLVSTAGRYGIPRVSPDGKRVVMLVDDGTQSDVWVYETERDVKTRLTFGGVLYSSPIWSPNGKYILFGFRGRGIFWTRADGGIEPKQLTDSAGTIQLPSSFTPDGKLLAYTDGTGSGDQGTHIWTVPIIEGTDSLQAGKPRRFLQSDFAENNPAISPDGRWLAYESTESGHSEVDVRPLFSQQPGSKWRVSSGGGTSPAWTRNGRELLYRNGETIMAVDYAIHGDQFQPSKPRTHIDTLQDVAAWGVSVDGNAIVALVQERPAAPLQRDHQIVFLENFFDELRRRVVRQ